MIKLTQDIWDTLQKIQREVNKYTYKTDMQLYKTPEFWTYLSEDGGDCEDYSLTKRKRLIEIGIDKDSLYLAIGKVRTGEAHCVLIVDTDQGAYAMDNNVEVVVPWHDCSIKTWIERWDPSDKWVAIKRI